MAQRKNKQPYIPYDYEAAFQQQLEKLDEQQTMELLRSGSRVTYATKRIDAGDQVELEIYPEFTKRQDIPPEARRKNYNLKAQRNMKDKNARKRCERLINANFTSRDLWATLSYTNNHLPASMEEAQANMQKYIMRINYRRKKMGLENARYVYVTEWSQEGETIRCHHHIVMDGQLSMDEVEKAWKLGRRNQVRRLDYDENGLSGLAHYITKDPKGKKRWCASKGLQEPVEHKNHRQFSFRKVKRMAENYDNAVDMISAAAPDCWFKGLERRCNPVNGLVYIYAKLRRKCAVGDLVYIRDAEDLGYEPKSLYILMGVDPDGTARVRKHSKKGREYRVALSQLHLVKKAGRSKTA